MMDDLCQMQIISLALIFFILTLFQAQFLQLTIITMFQHLLKRTKPKNQETVQKNFETLSNEWQSPFTNRYERSQPSAEDRQTPSFLSKLNKISRRIQIVELGFQQGDQLQQNQKNSQILQINELIDQQLNPMILSNIHPNPRINRSIFVHLRNATYDLKQAYFGFTLYLQDQRKLMQDFHKKIADQIERFCSKFRSKQLQEASCYQIQHLKTQNYTLRQQIERKLSDHQTFNNQAMFCNRCKQLQHELAKLNEEFFRSEETIQKLQIDNEKLQQHIFDIQQKIVGVELEVEKRLKQRLLLLPEYYNSRATNNKEIHLLKDEIKVLRESSKKMEEQLAISKRFQLNFEKLKLAQQQLREAEMKSQKIKQTNYLRQQQILEAQQNLSKKIIDIHKKQADLSSWEAQITRKQAQIRNSTCQKKFLNQQADNRAGQTNQLRISRQLSLNSFGRVPLQDEEPQRNFDMRQRHKTYESGLELINQQARRQHQQVGRGNRRIEAKSYIQIENISSNRDKFTIYNKKPILTGSNKRYYGENSHYRTVTQQRNRLQQTGERNAPQYRDLSKKSRNSGTKSMKNGFNFTANQPKIHNQGYQLSGLGSKLQRLRDQIKKEIQSIK